MTLIALGLASCSSPPLADPWSGLSDGQLQRVLEGDPQFRAANYPNCAVVLFDPPGAQVMLKQYLVENTFAVPGDHTLDAAASTCRDRVIADAKEQGASVVAADLMHQSLRSRAVSLGLLRR